MNIPLGVDEAEGNSHLEDFESFVGGVFFSLSTLMVTQIGRKLPVNFDWL